VIGINTLKMASADGIAFALPIDDVKRVVAQLQTHGRVLRPYLGLKFVELDATIAAELRTRVAGSASGGGGGGGMWGRAGGGRVAEGAAPSLPEEGLHVLHVTPDSPAYRAGVRVGDTLVGVDGAPLRTTKSLIDALQDKVGHTVALDVVRAEQRVGVRCHVERMQD